MREYIEGYIFGVLSEHALLVVEALGENPGAFTLQTDVCFIEKLNRIYVTTHLSDGRNISSNFSWPRSEQLIIQSIRRAFLSSVKRIEDLSLPILRKLFKPKPMEATLQ